MSPECLLTEFFVSTVLHCIYLESVRVSVHVMVFSEHVAHRPEREHDEANQSNDYFRVWHLVASYELQVLRNIVSHLGS